MTIEMEKSNQEDMGVDDLLLFRRLLAELKEKGIVKYGNLIQNGVKRKVFWLQ
jgi:hypothetical protein